MSASVNLVPARVALGQQRTRRLRAWMLASAISVPFPALALAFSARLANVSAELEAQVARGQQSSDAHLRRLQVLSQEIALLQQKAATLSAIYRRDEWTQRLAALFAAAPSELMLTTCAFEPLVSEIRIPAQPPASTPGQPAAAASAPPRYTLRLEGRAQNHRSLADFVDKARTIAGFRSLQLGDTRSAEFQGQPVIEFTIHITAEDAP